MRLIFTFLFSLLSVSGSLLAGDVFHGHETAPTTGTTTFNNAFSASGGLAGPGVSPISADNVGTLISTGWDFTGTAPGGTNLSISAIAGGANPGGAADFAIRMSSGSGTVSMQSGAVASDDGSNFHLQSVYFRIAGASAPDVIITGYLNGVAVSGATLTVSGLASGSWNLFDVSANAAFNNINEFRFTQASSTTVTITQMIVDQITIAAPINLPLTLTDFSGQRSGNNVTLQWTTAIEQNTLDFDIQRGADGTTYTSVGQVAAAGNSTQPLNYQFTDALPVSTASAWFYRLMMTDKDGRFTYSPVLRIGAVVPSVLSISTYPNPFSNQLTLSIESVQPDNALISVTDMSGRILVTERLPLQKGGNLLPLSLGLLAKGIYSLSVSTAGVKRTIGIVKSD